MTGMDVNGSTSAPGLAPASGVTPVSGAAPAPGLPPPGTKDAVAPLFAQRMDGTQPVPSPTQMSAVDAGNLRNALFAQEAAKGNAAETRSTVLTRTRDAMRAAPQAAPAKQPSLE
jgi:hypothetical protein